MNLNRLTLGGRIIAIAGLVFFIDSFLPWFKAPCVDLGALGGKICGQGTHNAWNNAPSLIAVLLTVGLVALIVVELAGNTLPPLGGITWAQVRLAAAGLAALLVLLQLLVGDSHATRAYGLYIGVVLAAVLVYGAFLLYREAPAAVPPQGGPYQQGPPPGYQQGPPPGYQQGPPPGYQAPPPGYQQGPPPPGYQQGPGV
ncbi:MAG: hypothetical protein V7637_5687 [Mycobacteriales bacterium]